jgi:class 3 adenylate cyclase/tetratricopeptide (TPR) repeat protein
MVTCAACGIENPAEARFCGGCGAALARPCPSCGAPTAAGFAFCPACGARIGDGEAPPAGEERKIVTAVFVDLVGFTSRASSLDPEEVRRLLVPYHGRVRSELERFGGTVEKFIGDAIMAVFGAPTAHEDDAERAVRAGLAVLEAIEELNAGDPTADLTVRIGINTGEAVVTLSARASEGEGMAAGDVVNTASRLQTAAPPGGILVGERTYAATRDAVEYSPTEVTVRGKSEPLAAFLVVKATELGEAAPRPDAPLVGRDRERELLLEAVERTEREETAQLLTLVGMPGIGKSRLVFELLQSLEESSEPVRSLVGRSLPYGDSVIFGALAETAKKQIGIQDVDRADAAGEKLTNAVAALLPDSTEARWVEGHLRTLVGLDLQADSASDRRGETFAAWRRFFEALAEQAPLVLVFEDLHWADDGLLDFVDHLVEWAVDVPLLVVATARPELLERRPGWGGGKRNALTISLAALSADETAELLEALLDETELPRDVHAALLTRAGGNPLYAGEYVRMLVGTGLLRRNGDGWAVKPGAELPLPASVQAVIAARLDALETREKSLLQSASVLGETFVRSAVAALGSMPQPAVDELLLSLERKEFVRRARQPTPGPDREYLFRHVLVRDVAYGQMARARRAEKHRLAAEWLESLGRPDEHAETLAYHYSSALALARATGEEPQGLAERARDALRVAGDRALTLDAFGQAARLYADALELTADDDPGRPDFLFRYGRALFHARLEGAEILAEARDALLARGDPHLAAEAEVLLAALRANEGRGDRAREHLARAQELVRDEPSSRSKAFVLSMTSRFLMLEGEEDEAIRVGREGLAMAEELQLDDIRAHTLTAIGTARITGADVGGLDDIEQSIAIAREINSAEVVRGLRHLGAAYALLGDLGRSFEHMQEARAAAERFGDAFNSRWLRASYTSELYRLGEWDEATRIADEFIAEASAGSPHYMESICRFSRGQVRLARGELDAAWEDARAGVEIARASQDEWMVHPSLAFCARAAVVSGRNDEASALVDEVLADWAERRPLPAYWLADLVVAARALGRVDEFAALAERETRRTHWLAAARAVAAGDFVTAADVYAEIGSLPDAAFSRLLAGQRAAALAFYEPLGAAVDVLLAQHGDPT